MCTSSQQLISRFLSSPKVPHTTILSRGANNVLLGGGVRVRVRVRVQRTFKGKSKALLSLGWHKDDETRNLGVTLETWCIRG